MATGWTIEYTEKVSLRWHRAFQEYWSKFCPAPHVMTRIIAQILGFKMPEPQSELNPMELAQIPGVMVNAEPIVVKVETIVLAG